MSRYTVAEPHTVMIDGVSYRPGDTVETTAGVADPWVAVGYLEPVADKPAKARKATPGR